MAEETTQGNPQAVQDAVLALREAISLKRSKMMSMALYKIRYQALR